MKSFWLLVALAGVVGTSAAWMVNYQRYGSKRSQFGKFSSDGEITAENVIELVKSEHLTEGPIVEMLTPEHYDFGLMSMGETGKKTFRLKNVGSEPMTLKEGRSTCKCTIGKLNNTELMPGEETSIDVEWTVKADSSDFEQRAQVITNDPNKIAIDLRIFGKILRKVEFEPAKISFGDVAAGDDFEVSTNVYSYFDNDIEPVGAVFMSKQMDDMADVKIEPIEVVEGKYEKARQAYRVIGKIKSGMRQGAVTTSLNFKFKQKQDDGKFLTDEETGDPVILRTGCEVSGRIIGSLSMVIGSKLRSVASGGYLYDFGKLSLDSKLTAKTLIVLKGSEKDKTTLSIGEISPKGVLKATLQEPKGRGRTMLVPLVLEVIPGDKPLDLTGKNRDEYARVWIESDNPKVPRMLVAVKFAIDAKP